MAHKDCVIVFDQNEHGTYFTGQVVTGKVIINLNKPKKLKGIKLEICGYAACQWRERHGRKRPQYNVKKRRKHVYTGREDYIASTTFLAGTDSNAPNFSMDAGTYTYTFACPIPVNCPSSFEGTFGHIRYLAKVTFIRSGASNRTQNVGFTVLKLLDLNRESTLLKSPANNDAMENFCFLQTKAVHIRVDLTQTGYVPGQIVLVSAQVNNESSFDCKKLVICLNLRATYTSDTPCMRTNSEKLTLVKKVCGAVPRRSLKNFAETIRVPATSPTCDHLSKVVRVAYEIRVIAVMNHFMRDPKASIPITIGNVPLMNGSEMIPHTDDLPTTSSCAMQLAESGESDDDFDTLETDEDDEGMELPPPTYEEAMFMTTDIADDDVNTVSEAVRFTPRYPVYDVDNVFAQSPPPNLPQKRRKKKRRQQPNGYEKERAPVESPVQI